MKDINQLLKMHDCQCKLPGVFFFWIAFLQNEIIEVWYLIVGLLIVHRAVNDCFDFILFVISRFKFFWL